MLHVDLDEQAHGGGSHFHSNSGEFTLSALGRKWAIDRGFHIAESKDNSVVLIDGRGQGFFPTGGQTVDYRDTAAATLVSGDAAESYHWMTAPHNHIGAPSVSAYAWEPDRDPQVVANAAEVAKVNKTEPWKDPALGGGYVYRAPYNPVEKAFRTALLRRAVTIPTC